MKRFLILIVLVLAGCGEQSPEEMIKQVNSSGTISDEQAESLSKVMDLDLNGLTSITDEQAGSSSKIYPGILHLNGLNAITDKQAKSLSRVEHLYLNGLTSDH